MGLMVQLLVNKGIPLLGTHTHIHTRTKASSPNPRPKGRNYFSKDTRIKGPRGEREKKLETGPSGGLSPSHPPFPLSLEILAQGGMFGQDLISRNQAQIIVEIIDTANLRG